MPFEIIAAVTLGAGLIGAGAAESAAGTQASAADRATASQRQMFDTINQQNAPWLQAGQTALGDIAARKDQFTHQFTAEDLKSNLSPSYNFMLQQGLGATQNALNVGGGNISGNTMRGMTKFAEDYASTGYQQAFENYTANQTNIFNRLS